MKSLYDELIKYSEKGMHPYHMPGHKRKSCGALTAGYASIDFTEAEGLDDLHDPQGIIKEAEEFAAKAIGSEETHFLINGSSSGILAAISACVKPGGKLVICRGCHKSVYNAMQIRNIRPAYIFPKLIESPLMEDAADAEDVLRALDENPDTEAVLIVSPTYEGRLSDIVTIAEAVHKRGMPLIVDQAHGAHLSFTKGSSADAVRNGADIVIESVHKTLPAPTQTALISVNGSIVSRDRLRYYLTVYQSSSPSYPLMAMIDGCIRYMSDNAPEIMPVFHDECEKILNRLSGCDKLYIRPDVKDLACGKADYGKMLVCTDRSDIDGKRLSEILRKEYMIEPEMVSPEYVLFMFTVCDEPADFERVADALISIDKACGKAEKESISFSKVPAPCTKMTLQEAFEADYEEIPLSEAPGRISSNLICMYPPGSPLIAPGEEIRGEHINILEEYAARGMNIKGLKNNKIRVVKNA